MTNYEQKTNRIKGEAESLRRQLAALDKELAASVVKTEELLSIAAECGVTVVGIGKKHPALKNEDWPFGVGGSIFTPPVDRTPDGWPAAWHIARRAGISAGAGNTGQHQADTSRLVDGVYELKGGVWARIDVEVAA